MRPQERDDSVPERDAPEESESSLVLLASFTGHGLTLAVATGLFLLAGWWIDGRVGTAPLFTIVGALVGAAAGFYSMLQHLLLRPRDEERRAGQGPDGRTGPDGPGGSHERPGPRDAHERSDPRDRRDPDPRDPDRGRG